MSRRVYTKAHASARIWGGSVDPLEVSRALRIPPDYTHRAGEPRLRRDGKGTIVEGPDWPHGMWSFSSEKWVQSPQLHRHLVWMLDQLECKAEQIAALLTAGAKADLYCYTCGATPNPPQLPQRLHARAAALGMSIGIDHYDDGDEEGLPPSTKEAQGPSGG